MNNLGVRIRRARELKGYRQEQVADFCGVSSAAIVSHWELDQNEPSCDTLVKLAEILEVSLDYLLDYDDPLKGNDTDPLVAIIKELGPDYYETALDQAREEKKRREEYRELFEKKYAATFEIQYPLFIDKTNPHYEENKKCIKRLSRIKQKRSLSDWDITSFLWRAGYSDKIRCADIIAVFLKLKVPNTQLLYHIQSYLEDNYLISFCDTE